MEQEEGGKGGRCLLFLLLVVQLGWRGIGESTWYVHLLIVPSLGGVATHFESAERDADRRMTGDHVGDW